MHVKKLSKIKERDAQRLTRTILRVRTGKSAWFMSQNRENLGFMEL
jgi:hypothetical protein